MMPLDIKYGKDNTMKLNQTVIDNYYKTILSSMPDKFSNHAKFIKIVQYKQHGRRGTRQPLAICYDMPLEYIDAGTNKVFRVVPAYPSVAVSNDGIVISCGTNKLVAVSRLSNYNRVMILTPLSGKRATILVHRLVALAWVKNIDFITYNVVDHIDGNKLNNISSNLRWLSNSQNTAMASNKSDSPWVIKDLKTGGLTNFHSLSALEAYTGYDRRGITASKCPMYLKSSRGEWILDTTAKFTNFGNNPKTAITGLVHKSVYNLYIDGVFTKAYSGIMEALNDHGRRGRLSVKDTTTYIKNYYHKVGKKAVFKDMVRKEPPFSYMARNTVTGDVVCSETIVGLAKKTGCKKSTVTSRFNHKIGQAIGGWLFKKSTDESYTIRIIPKQITVTLVKNDDEQTFNSLRQASEYLGVDKITLGRYNNKILKGYTVKVLR